MLPHVRNSSKNSLREYTGDFEITCEDIIPGVVLEHDD
jgi:hypothetical protein